MVKTLFIKPRHKHPVEQVKQLEFSTVGILGNVPCQSLRQVLIVSTNVIKEFNLEPGDLKENIVINYDSLHSLSSGSVLKIGMARIRLTFHCEPCHVIKDKVNIKAIQHKRGYLGQFLNQGKIDIGDKVEFLGIFFSPIPYEIKNRLNWYLSQCNRAIFVSELLIECGLSPSYARAIPALIKNFPSDLRNKVLFQSKKK